MRRSPRSHIPLLNGFIRAAGGQDFSVWGESYREDRQTMAIEVLALFLDQIEHFYAAVSTTNSQYPPVAGECQTTNLETILAQWHGLLRFDIPKLDGIIKAARALAGFGRGEEFTIGGNCEERSPAIVRTAVNFAGLGKFYRAGRHVNNPDDVVPIKNYGPLSIGGNSDKVTRCRV